MTGNRFIRFIRFINGSCPLSPLDNTALRTADLKISSSEAIENHSTGAEDGAGLPQVRGIIEGAQGVGQRPYWILSESEATAIFGRREFSEPPKGASPNTAL